MAEKKEFSYEIIKNFGSFGVSGEKWEKRLTLISWDGKPPVYDLRSWHENGERMGKGISLTDGELFDLMSLIEDVLEGGQRED